MSERADHDFAVPIIDIGPYTSGGDRAQRQRVARQVDDACRNVGFLQVVHHGIPDAVIGDLARSIDEFFALPSATKQSFQADPGANRGYTPPRSEALSLSAGIVPASDLKDYFEAFNIGVEARDFPKLDLPKDHYADNIWPTQLSDFQTHVSRYFSEAERVARTLTWIFADALDLPPDFFNSYTDHSIEILRMNHYALPEAEIDVLDNSAPTGMGEHTDFGIVTVLWADMIPGLQVLGFDQQWHDVLPANGALLVNLGDLMARWTNDRWMSTLHRVRPPIVDGRVQRRRSAAFFLDGNSDAVISTIESCRADDHDEAGRRSGSSGSEGADGWSTEGSRDPTATSGYDPISVDQHVKAKLAGSRGGVVNHAATREASRILAAQARA